MKALNNRFYVKFMQLEIGLLVLAVGRLVGESPSITRRDWQREIDQIISRQALL